MTEDCPSCSRPVGGSPVTEQPRRRRRPLRDQVRRALWIAAMPLTYPAKYKDRETWEREGTPTRHRGGPVTEQKVPEPKCGGCHGFGGNWDCMGENDPADCLCENCTGNENCPECGE